MQSSLKLIGAAALLSVSFAAHAAVIDLPGGTNDGTTLTTPEATVTAGPNTTLIVGDFIDNAVCPLGALGCNGSMTLTFNFDVNGVSFDYGFGDPGDSAQLSIFDRFGALLGSLGLNLTSGTASADLSGFGTLRSIVFDNTAATGAGYAYGNINYNGVPVPEPTTLPLLLAALGGISLFRRKKSTA